jgi:hypothetical protein
MQDTSAKSALKSQIKIVSTVAMLVAIALSLWHTVAPLPALLNTVFPVVCVVLVIHGVEGAIASFLILLNRLSSKNNPSSQPQSILIDHLPNNTPLAILKAGLYTFFVGTVGLSEIITATRKSQP